MFESSKYECVDCIWILLQIPGDDFMTWQLPWLMWKLATNDKQNEQKEMLLSSLQMTS